MSTTKIATSVRFDEDLLLKLTSVAKKERRSFNAQLEYITQLFLEEYEKKNGIVEIEDEDRHRR